MTKTFQAQTREGPLEVPIKKEVSICSIPGFAIHRGVNYSCNGVYDHGWTVSHTGTGLRLAHAGTIKEVIATAEASLHKSGYDTPRKFAKFIRGMERQP